MKYKIGSVVKMNSENWVNCDFDSWGKGIRVGVVVEPSFSLEGHEVDVGCPEGRCFENTSQLLQATEEDYKNQEKNV